MGRMSVRVRRRVSGSIAVDVTGPNGFDIRGVDMVPEALDVDDERVLAPALAVLNEWVARWGVEVTCEQVRRLA